MERVLFLVERTGQRITCLLNPESVVLRRQAGVRVRRDATGILTGLGQSDDPLLATGGGVTEIDLSLLFDVQIAAELTTPFAAPTPATTFEVATPTAAPDSVLSPDVRELTQPLWRLAENAADGGLPVVRFIWGRAWNVPGVVVAAAERLERFAPDGSPGRSWFRLRFRRVSDTDDRAPSPAPPPVVDPDGVERMVLPVEPSGLPGLRIDLLAGVRTGDPSNYREYAAQSDIDDPLRIAEGTVLRIAATNGGRLT